MLGDEKENESVLRCSCCIPGMKCIDPSFSSFGMHNVFAHYTAFHLFNLEFTNFTELNSGSKSQRFNLRSQTA